MAVRYLTEGEAAVNKWWNTRIEELKVEHNTDTSWGIPRDVWHEAQAEYTRRMREVFGRDPDSGDKTAQRKKAERMEAVQAPAQHDEDTDDSIDEDAAATLDQLAGWHAKQGDSRAEGLKKVRDILDQQFPGI
jgi:hypothetical protein